MDEVLARKKWTGHYWTSKSRKLRPLTFDEYKAKIIEAGIEAKDIGLKAGMYMLCRNTDSGDYTLDSCRFATPKQNSIDRISNGGHAEMVKKKTGRTKHTHEYLKKISEFMSQRTVANYPHLENGRKITAEKLRGRTKYTDKGRAIASEKNSKFYSFISPDGVKHQGKNVEEFAKSIGLKGSGFSRMKTGRLKQYRGWTRDPDWKD